MRKRISKEGTNMILIWDRENDPTFTFVIAILRQKIVALQHRNGFKGDWHDGEPEEYDEGTAVKFPYCEEIVIAVNKY